MNIYSSSRKTHDSSREIRAQVDSFYREFYLATKKDDLHKYYRSNYNK